MKTHLFSTARYRWDVSRDSGDLLTYLRTYCVVILNILYHNWQWSPIGLHVCVIGLYVWSPKICQFHYHDVEFRTRSGKPKLDILLQSDATECPMGLLYCIVLYSFIVQVDRTQLILHANSFAYIMLQKNNCLNRLLTRTSFYQKKTSGVTYRCLP